MTDQNYFYFLKFLSFTYFKYFYFCPKRSFLLMRNFLRLSIYIVWNKKNRVTENWILEILSLKKILKNDPSYNIIVHSAFIQNYREILVAYTTKRGHWLSKFSLTKCFFFHSLARNKYFDHPTLGRTRIL